jgi:beta-phosphoglucomutase-like phosphatase (HAD superfamily)
LWTTTPRALFDTALARGGFTVDVSVAADEVVAPEPAPDLYLAACAVLDVAPGEAIAF